MHTQAHAQTHTHTNTHLHTYLNMCLCIYICVHIYSHTHTRINISCLLREPVPRLELNDLRIIPRVPQHEEVVVRHGRLRAI